MSEFQCLRLCAIFLPREMCLAALELGSMQGVPSLVDATTRARPLTALYTNEVLPINICSTVTRQEKEGEYCEHGAVKEQPAS